MVAQNTTKNLVAEGDYIVFLPRDVPVDNYDRIPKIAETHAGSERDAVSNILFRNLSKEQARIVMGKLDKDYGGVEKHAVIIPKTGATTVSRKDLNSKTRLDTDNFIDYALAGELAAKKGSNCPEEYIQQARNLLKGVGRFP